MERLLENIELTNGFLWVQTVKSMVLPFCIHSLATTLRAESTFGVTKTLYVFLIPVSLRSRQHILQIYKVATTNTGDNTISAFNNLPEISLMQFYKYS